MKDLSKKAKPSYVWYRDSKMVGTILLLVIVALQIFAFLRVPGISTIHAYTIGMLFGWYSPLFYVYVAYFALRMMFGQKVALPKWFKLHRFTYWFIALSLMFLSVTVIFPYYQVKMRDGFTMWGKEPWGAFDKWFSDFRQEAAWAPANTNGGVLGAFMFALTASATSGIGAMFISIGLMVFSVSIVVSGSFIGFYKDLMHKRKESLENNEKAAQNDLPMDELARKTQEVNVAPSEEKVQNKPEETIDDFPFEDPFK